MIYYSTIYAVEFIYFDSNTQETMKKQLYPSDSSNFLPLHWKILLIFLLWHRRLHVFLTFVMRKNDVTPSYVKKTWTMGRTTS